MQKQIILTGDRPTGKLHLGHYVGSLKNRVELQAQYKQYILIADVQALTDNASNPRKIRKSLKEVVLDYLAVGIDPNITNICIQSMIPAIAELTIYYLNLVSLPRLERNPTVREELKQKNFKEGIPAGFLIYPVSQAADITAFGANLVPVGEDQLPVLEQTKEIVRKFNSIYGETLVEPEALLSKFSRLPGIDGQAKMGKSLGNAIYLSDEPDQVYKKIMSMYTDPTHILVQDPGKIEGNMVFTYLDVFCEDKEKLSELKEHYQKGGLGDVKVKKYLYEVLEKILLPIRTKRKEFAKDEKYIEQILKQGTQQAIELTQKNLENVKKAMGIDYLNSLF